MSKQRAGFIRRRRIKSRSRDECATESPGERPLSSRLHTWKEATERAQINEYPFRSCTFDSPDEQNDGKKLENDGESCGECNPFILRFIFTYTHSHIDGGLYGIL